MTFSIFDFRFSIACGITAMAAMVGHARADTPATMIDGDLRTQRVSIEGLDRGKIGFFDDQKRYVSEPVDHVVQLRDIGAAAALSSGKAMIELMDGQRLTGHWVTASPDGQAFEWDHPLLGVVTISLENLRAMTLIGSPLEQSNNGSDRIKLANGDLVEGFVSRVAAAGVEIKPAGGSQPVTLPFDRITALRLANTSPKEKPARYPVIWLDDGSRLIATSFSIADDQLKFVTPLTIKDGSSGTSGETIPLTKAVRIDLATAAGDLVPLTGLKPTIVSGGEVFGVASPPRNEGDNLRLHAPVALRYELPAGSVRFAAVANLDVAAEEAARAAVWADFEIVARVDGKEVGRWHITGRQPTAVISVPAAGASLTIELLPGVNGPVFDRLRLVEPVLLVRGG